MSKRAFVAAAFAAGMAIAGIAFAGNIKFDMPKEMTGFKGTLVAKVYDVQVPGDKWSPAGWVAIGDIRVAGFSAPCKFSAAEVTASWKDKFANVGAKDDKVKFPADLKVGDWVGVECFQREGHLRATKMQKVDPVKLGLEKPDASKPAK